MDQLRLMVGGQVKRAAVLLFHPDPERYVTGASIKIGYFGDDGEVRYQDVISGNLFVQVDKTMDLLLTKYLKAGISYEGVQRVETYPVPEAALRETLMNAVAHKDYGSGTPIQIKVYADHLVFWNNGQLPETWTVQRLLGNHPSQPYNPDIANVLFNAGMIESWGQGIEKVLRTCREHGIPAPELHYESIGLEVEFRWTAPRPESRPESGKDRQAGSSHAQPESGDRSQSQAAADGRRTKSGLSGDQVGRPELRPGSLEHRVAMILLENPLAKSDIAEALGHTTVSGQLNKAVRALMKAELIAYTIPTKPTSRLQKYRITDKGRAALADRENRG